ncbi:MAG: AmmeMemoRadiSam system protein B [Rhodothermales bacterium]|nr:AmmeMemoRadiSam system protein B [Rhodothermales bacterium]MDG2016118.1 AmmeMemoRadiSam system protein B [Rhodothermales bacterium]
MPEIEASKFATQRDPLDAQVSGFLKASQAQPVDFFAHTIIVPNSALVTGGSIAADAYKSLPCTDFDTVISIAPSEVGTFRKITVCSLARYNSPLGEVAVDDRIRNELCDEDDDIYVSDMGHFDHRGIDIQLPFLQKVCSDFSVAPLVMGMESVDFCKELGSAVGEIMFNRNTLTVACVDILSATPVGLARFEKYIIDLDVSRMMILLNQENEIVVRGKGGVLTAMIAANHRRANAVHISGRKRPEDGSPGFIGALIGRS